MCYRYESKNHVISECPYEVVMPWDEKGEKIVSLSKPSSRQVIDYGVKENRKIEHQEDDENEEEEEKQQVANYTCDAESGELPDKTQSSAD
jgi:hypothetical protein